MQEERDIGSFDLMISALSVRKVYLNSKEGTHTDYESGEKKQYEFDGTDYHSIRKEGTCEDTLHRSKVFESLCPMASRVHEMNMNRIEICNRDNSLGRTHTLLYVGYRPHKPVEQLSMSTFVQFFKERGFRRISIGMVDFDENG